MPKLMPISIAVVKESSQTPVETETAAGSPPSNVDPTKNGVGMGTPTPVEGFFSVEDVRAMSIEPVVIADVLSPLTMSEPTEPELDPDA